MDNLDDILKQRKTPKAPSNLAHRIVQAADVDQKPRVFLRQKLFSYLEPLFMLPRPAYVMAVALVFALFLGVGMGPFFQGQSGVSEIEYDLVAYMLLDEDAVW